MTTPTPPSSTTTGRRIDLDAARKARDEERRSQGIDAPPVAVIGGTEYVLPAELPADVVTSFGMVVRGDVAALEDAMSALFAGNLPAIKAHGLSWEDEKYLLEETLKEYGFELPESSASGDS